MSQRPLRSAKSSPGCQRDQQGDVGLVAGDGRGDAPGGNGGQCAQGGAQQSGNSMLHGNFSSLPIIIYLQIVQRVHERAVDQDAEMAVVAAGHTGRAHAGDLLTLIDMLAR